MPTAFTRTRDLRGAVFHEVDLRDIRITEAHLGDAVLRGVVVTGMEVDSPWLDEGSFVVNGVDVAPLVEVELERRFPGRSLRHAEDPAGLREAWAAVERAWDRAVARAAAMPPGTVDEQVAGEWSFAQTLRHLVLATDVWLGKTVLARPEPFHPLGLVHEGAADEGFDMSVLTAREPSYDEVLAVRAERRAMVRDHLAQVTPEQLEETRANPWAPEHQETVRHCLQVILGEEWEHLRFALRDLEALATDPTTVQPGAAPQA